ncbi:syntaxin-124-like [Olea europaea subsp. europaea]|uniref:Syntaxin-124-like n=1 Tax=Olea europaea subsp. europaea TaxID=158383 RepID=A0A8S0V0T6_OLEEU|nr:syntaxin-124-like [Olea europaea subsp. europaea]
MRPGGSDFWRPVRPRFSNGFWLILCGLVILLFRGLLSKENQQPISRSDAKSLNAKRAGREGKFETKVYPTPPPPGIKICTKRAAKMNDLFSNSFKKFQDLKDQVQMNDLEAGGKESVNLNRFFDDVENVKKDMSDVEKLYKRLQESNEESKIVQNAKTMKELRSKMDSDVAQVLKRVKIIKGKLEALERSNAAQRKIPGCGPGSSADRTRTSVVSGLGKKLKDMMDDFQGLRARMNAEYKETVGRRYFTVTGEKANEDMIENLISSGESETFLQKAIQEQGRGQILDTISEIQERHDAVKEIEKNLIELHQIFLDMAALVEAQGQQLNDIESHVAHASSFVRRGTENLQEAREYQKSSRKCTCIAIILIIAAILLLLFPIWSQFLLHL